MIANHNYTEHLNSSHRWCSWLINKRHTVVDLLSVNHAEIRECFVGDDGTIIHRFISICTVQIESFIRLTSDASGRLPKRKRLGKAQKILLKPLRFSTLSGFSSTWKSGIAGTLFSSVVSYSCNILQVNNICCIRLVTTVQQPCTRCSVLQSNIQDLRNGLVMTFIKIKEVLYRVKGILASHKSLEHL